jgi:hypothetical protein
MHLSERAPRLDAIRAENFGVLETIVARALAKDPAERYEDAAAMSRALDAVRQSSSDLVVDKSIPLDADDIVESAPIQYPATLPGFPVTKASAPTGVPAIREPPGIAKASAPAGVPAIPESAIATQVLEPTTPPAKLEPAANPDEPRSGDDAGDRTAGSGRAQRRRRGSEVVIPASSSGRRVVVVIVLLGVIAAGLGLALSQGWLSPAPRPPAEAPRATHATASDPVPKIAAKAAELASSGRAELALEQLNAGRLAHPASALLAYRAGRLYAERGTWREAFTAFRDAIRRREVPQRCRSDPRCPARLHIASDFAPHAAFLHDDTVPPPGRSSTRRRARITARRSGRERLPSWGAIVAAGNRQHHDQWRPGGAIAIRDGAGSPRRTRRTVRIGRDCEHVTAEPRRP